VIQKFKECCVIAAVDRSRNRCQRCQIAADVIQKFKKYCVIRYKKKGGDAKIMRIITHHLRQAVLLIWLRMIEHIVTTFFLITVSCVYHFTTVAYTLQLLYNK